MYFEIKPPGKLSLGLQELWQFRELFYYFTWRDIKVKYKQTILGFTWAILQPLTMMVVFTLFFGKSLGVPSDSLPYPLFVLSGLLLWNVFSSGLSGAANSMVANSGMIKKIFFPRLIIPMSAILAALFDFVIALGIFLIMQVYYSIAFNWTFLIYLPLALIVTITGTFGLGTLLAALNIKYRDFRYVLPFITQLLLFVTPVIYPPSVIENNWLLTFMYCNPVSGSIDLFRSALMGSAPHWDLIIFSGGSALALFLIGIFYFRKTEHFFADIA